MKSDFRNATSRLASLLLSVASLFGAPHQRAAAADVDWMPRVGDRTQLWWVDGPPKVLNSPVRPKEQILCFAYGDRRLMFDTRRVRPVDGKWECAIVADGKRYACSGRTEGADEFFQPVRFVEAGRFFQRVAIEELQFTSDDGSLLPSTARLEILTWPDRLAYRLECADDVTLELRFGDKKVNGRKAVLLAVENPQRAAVVESELHVTLDATLGCHRIALPEKPWSNASGTYYPEEHLDRVDRWRVSLRNDGDSPTVAPLMFTQQHHLPITGFTPLLCDPDGTPTGLPVQLSKNWHQRPEKGRVPHDGAWFHGFAWVRVPPRSKRDFVFQMVYARYGGVFAASHSQLSLIGWGHNQFWDEAAVGSFGESICFEPGRVQRRCFITDIRPLMTFPREANPKRWGWAENCGGGDFLMWIDAAGRYQSQKGTRVDYRSHGPCLTDVSYHEQSAGGEIDARIDVSLPATNDHLRTFIRLRYDVRKLVRWQRLAFFQLGADFYNDVPARRVAVGDITGLREEWKPRLAKDEYDRRSLPLTGAHPWVSIHGVDQSQLTKGHAAASRGLIVRSWKAVLGGKDAAPHLSAFCTEWGKNNHRTSLELSPPPDVVALQPGDFVEAELELVVFPADPAAYYGPDSSFLAALKTHADTWSLVHREAARNALQVTAQRGAVLRPYPLVIAADDQQQAKVALSSPTGHLPVTFVGLTQPRGHVIQVDGQAVDRWQTDWDHETQRWRISCNVPAQEDREIRIELLRRRR